MEMLMLLVELGRKTLVGVLLVVLAWAAVAVPTASIVGRVIARADADAPVVCGDCYDDEEARR